MMQRKLYVISFLVLFTAQLYGMESDFAMNKQDAPTNVEIPTLQALCLQKFCKEIQETLDEEGIQEVEQLAYLNPEIVAPEIANQIKETLVQDAGLYSKSALKDHIGWMAYLVYDTITNRLFAVSVFEDGTIRIWDTTTGTCTQVLEGHTSWITCLVYDATNKRLFSGSHDKTIRIWDTTTGICTQVLEGYTDYEDTCLVYDAATKRLFSGGCNGSIKIWDTTSTCIQTLEGHTSWVTCLVYDAASKRLFSGSRDGTVKIWDIHTGTCAQTLEGHNDDVECLVYDAVSKRLFSGADDKTIRVWDTTTGTCTQILEGDPDALMCLIYDAATKRLVSGSSDNSDKTTIRIWQAASFTYTLCTLAVCSVKNKNKLDNVKASQTYQQLSDEEKEAIDRHIKRLKK